MTRHDPVSVRHEQTRRAIAAAFALLMTCSTPVLAQDEEPPSGDRGVMSLVSPLSGYNFHERKQRDRTGPMFVGPVYVF